MKKYLTYYRSISIAVIILILTTLPGDNLNHLPLLPIPFLDKIAHFLLFFVFAIVLFADIIKIERVSPGMTFLSVFLISLFYGISIELVQWLLVSDRSAELFDIMANAFGILAGCLLQIKYKIFRY